MLAAPEYVYDFEALGAPVLAADWLAVRATLTAHAAATAAACAGLLMAAMWDPLWTRYCAR